MKIWVMVFMLLEDKLESLVELIEDKVEKVALGSRVSGNIMMDFDKIVKLNDEKIALINIKVANDSIRALVRGEDYWLLHNHFVVGKSLVDIALELKSSRSKIYRRVNIMVAKISKLLGNIGITEHSLEELAKINIIAMMRKRCLMRFSESDALSGGNCADKRITCEAQGY